VASGTSKYDDTGSTACTAVLADSELTVAYLGDSRLALIRPGSVDLFTPAHRVEHPEERARIIARGGTIVGQYLFRGTAGVMLTRAFGDGWYRPVGLIDRPDLLRVDLDATAPHLVVLATDGLWDVVGPETIAKLLLDWIRMECFADVDHARALVDLALANDALDNVTVVTIASMPADGPAPA
jgi:serine/threonine protein phosphatase PrpC